jgi:cytochrome c556
LIPVLFPGGTETGHDTKAKPEIWSDRAGFEAAASKFSAAASKLVEAASSGDRAAFMEAFKATGAACGQCHRSYKLKLN